MKMLLFARRNGQEILRDPLNLAFGLVFPLALLGLFCAIQANIPVPIFALPSLTPGILVFGFSFFSLFSALLVARERTSAFFLRLYTTPLRPRDSNIQRESVLPEDCQLLLQIRVLYI